MTEAAEIRAETFQRIGRLHALEALDQRAAYADAFGEYEDNLRDTLAEIHGDARPVEIEIALEAFRATFEAGA